MKDLYNLGLKADLQNILSDRNFKVRIGSTLSDPKIQEGGVPQGCILSVTLYNIKINNIVNFLNHEVDSSFYVDDLLICHRLKDMHTTERQLQMCKNKLN